MNDEIGNLPEVLIFLGAGASKAFADIPTMKEMVTLFEKRLPSEEAALDNLYREILDSLKGQYPEGLDLEAILSVLNGISKGRTFKELGFYSSYWARKQGLDPLMRPGTDLQGVADKLRDFLEKSINSYCEIKPNVKSNLFGIYSKLSEILPAPDRHAKKYDGRDFWESNRWAIYTTNYDLSIETICKDAGIEINKGSKYDELHGLRIVQPELLQAESFKIVKLHGSISWYMRDDGIIAEYPEGKPSSVWEAKKLREQIMLYPVEEKAMYEEPYIVLLNQFRQELKHAPRWLFIGYSFNDPFLLRIIEYCSASKRIIVIHPHSNTLKQNRLSNLKSQLITSEKRFGDETLWGELGNWLSQS
jgi:hypothetical protein